jgi:hypothetical protein
VSRYQEWLANNPPALDMTPDEQWRFRKQIIAGCIGIGDCWVWNGAKSSNGYGNIRVGYSNRTVSRLALCLAENAPLSISADACHIAECPSRACCNPAHLFFGEHQPNCSMRESRDVRWNRYIDAMAPSAKNSIRQSASRSFVVFEKRYKVGWGWLDCRTVQGTAHALSYSIAKPTALPTLIPAIA